MFVYDTAQSALGIGWAVVQPLFSMIIYTIIFGRLTHVESDGVPYAIFSFVALAPWTYFANSVTDGTASLVTNAHLITKVYFPRLVLPLSAVLAKLVDFGITMVLVFALLAFYGIVPNSGILMLPLLIVLMVITSAGIATWLTALAVQYRDVNYAISFVVQLLMYAAPVIYPARLIPAQYRSIYALNPMVGVIEGFRAALLSTHPMPWADLAIGTASALLIALGGVFYFRSREAAFADVA